MKDIKIWHNPRCSKSRASFALLDEKNIDAEVVKYLDVPPTEDELKALLVMLGMQPRELMRTKEEIYKELNLKSEDDNATLIKAMVENPKLIERPIVVKGDKAVIGRPIENVIELLG
ncbi:MAG TPA: arsenate reductase (glutaredoxin) [Campylobacterales bacterium]|nr:arsenate reductase (glutaredoxin) [Campylobacterales bacterium]